MIKQEVIWHSIKDEGLPRNRNSSYKTDGNNIIQSYDKDTFDKHFKGNICVGLTGYETNLILKKMKQLGWYSK